MGDLKGIIGIAASILSLIGPLPYIRGIIRNTIKPHAFSWFVWGVTLATGFGIQISEGAGAGAWSTGTGAISCFAIFFFALKKSDRSFSMFDWTCLAGAGLSFVLWRVTDRSRLQSCSRWSMCSDSCPHSKRATASHMKMV